MQKTENPICGGIAKLQTYTIGESRVECRRKEKILKGYKIVKKIEFNSKSILISLNGLPYIDLLKRLILKSKEIEYFINKWAEPYRGSGPLTIFKNINRAKEFIEDNNLLIKNIDYQIYECDWIPWSEKLMVLSWTSRCERSMFFDETFSKTALWTSDGQHLSVKKLPKGTGLAKKVMLKKFVEEGKKL